MRSADDWFLYNCWYAAAWTSEIEDGQPLARTYLEKPIVIYRGEDGQYVALDNRCCHRSAPLGCASERAQRQLQEPYRPHTSWASIAAYSSNDVRDPWNVERLLC